MAIKDLYPSIRPTLDLNFAETRTVDPRITFTRASTATYFNEFGVMRTALANVPRIDFDPTTLECKGLLIEEQRTNLLTYSEQLNNAVWGIASATATPDSTVAPDGAQTADTLVEASGTGVLPRLSWTQTITNATTYSISIYAKEVSGSAKRYLQVYANSGFTQVSEGGSQGANFDLGSGTVTLTNGFSASITAVGNGWYRCSVITSTSNATVAGFRIALQDSPTAQMALSWNPTGTGSIALWGAQLEAGSFQTSYIKTEGSQVTRAADIASMSGANFSSWYNQSEGTLFADAVGVNNISGATRRFAEISNNGSSLDRQLIGYGTTTGTRFLIVTNDITQADITAFAIAGTTVKTAAAYKANSFQQATNGVTRVEDTLGNVPVVNQIVFGGYSTTPGPALNGHISRMTYYPKRLSNINLQSLTA